MPPMNAYSEDLRKKIVQALRRGTTKSEAARSFGVSRSSVKRYAKLADEGRPLGHVKLKDLTAEHLDELYTQKSNSGLGARTVNYIHSTIRVALQRAVKKRLIPYNVARDAEPPKQVQREYTTLSREQLAAFFKVAAETEDRFEAFFIMAALAGLRPGELLALAWQDLKLPEGPGEAGEAMVR